MVLPLYVLYNTPQDLSTWKQLSRLPPLQRYLLTRYFGAWNCVWLFFLKDQHRWSCTTFTSFRLYHLLISLLLVSVLYLLVLDNRVQLHKTLFIWTPSNPRDIITNISPSGCSYFLLKKLLRLHHAATWSKSAALNNSNFTIWWNFTAGSKFYLTKTVPLHSRCYHARYNLKLFLFITFPIYNFSNL